MTRVERDDFIKKIEEDLIYLGLCESNILKNFKNIWGTPGRIGTVKKVRHELSNPQLLTLRKQIDATLQKLPVAKE